MIFPILKGIERFEVAPVTWMLFFLSVGLSLVGLDQRLVSQRELNTSYEDPYFLKTQGLLFAQFIEYQPQYYSKMLQSMAKKSQQGDLERTRLLGLMGARNTRFLKQGPNFDFEGDEVAIQWWKKKLKEQKWSQERHPSYIHGLSSSHFGMANWLSYQFVHSGGVHLMGNMIFLLLFGAALESLLGGAALLILYLGSGMVAAGTFLFLSGLHSVPLVGASGAISGLMALFCFLYWKKPVRYFYFLFIPKKGYSGFVYLPAWLIFVMWAITDLAGYFSSLSDVGGVAYTAHLGGQAAGILMGLVVYLFGYGREEQRENSVHVVP